VEAACLITARALMLLPLGAVRRTVRRYDRGLRTRLAGKRAILIVTAGGGTAYQADRINEAGFKDTSDALRDRMRTLFT
jgi:putative NADPH-quinone reductase